MDKFDKTNTELLESALLKLKEGQSTEYYNQVEDEQNRGQYYKGIGFPSANEDVSNNEKKKYIFNKLSELVRITHKNQLPYQPSVHLYPDVDLQPDNIIRSIYSKKEYSPETLIYEDFRIDQERGRLIREKILSVEESGGQFLSQLLESSEDYLPYNCEHIVPQSWFGKHQPMKGDLHHLFACERDCNQFRGNIPYFDFTGVKGTVKTDCGQRKGSGFEPFDGKGAISRAVLYFLLRYPGEINRISNEYTEIGLNNLLNWHDKYPPEVYEKHRNAMIFRKQGNRNPFIDYPSGAAEVNFNLGLG